MLLSLIPDKFTLFSIVGQVPAYDCNINPRRYIKTILILGTTYIVYKQVRKALSDYSKNNKLIISDMDEITNKLSKLKDLTKDHPSNNPKPGDTQVNILIMPEYESSPVWIMKKEGLENIDIEEYIDDKDFYRC